VRSLARSAYARRGRASRRSLVAGEKLEPVAERVLDVEAADAGEVAVPVRCVVGARQRLGQGPQGAGAVDRECRVRLACGGEVALDADVQLLARGEGGAIAETVLAT